MAHNFDSQTQIIKITVEKWMFYFNFIINKNKNNNNNRNKKLLVTLFKKYEI